MTRLLEHPLGNAPAEGGAKPIAPGVHWLRMPLPFPPRHINLWLLDDGDDLGWTTVDTGLRSRRGQAAWEQVCDTTLGGRPLRRVIVTHYHQDHLGLAAWLAERTGARVFMTRAEWLYAAMLGSRTGERWERSVRRFYERTGAPAALVEAVANADNPYAAQVPHPPAPFSRLRDGQRIDAAGRPWTVIVGSGHSPEHACLHQPDLGLLIAGDLLLPDISPNLSVWPPEPEADTIGDYMASLDRLAALPEDTLVLPAHGEPFRGLRERVADLRAHHATQLDTAEAACRHPVTVWQVCDRLYPNATDFVNRVLALGEALAHLNRLVADGRITRDGSGGADLYVRTTEA